jgi:hypothetical protein
MSRLADLRQFYELLYRLQLRVGGPRTLADFRQFNECPKRGVYFFFEPGEIRRESGTGARVVRVGTHGLNAGSKSTLRQRLGQHRGSGAGGGNHRTSIFRLLIGDALLASIGHATCPSWGVKGDAGHASKHLGLDRTAMKAAEAAIEQRVTRYIATLPFAWLDIPDEAGPESKRGYIERNAIALLSNFGRDQLDAPSTKWLGHNSSRDLVRDSGMWNQRHVDEGYDAAFLHHLVTSSCSADSE